MDELEGASVYDSQFFANQVDGSMRSAERVVPYVLNLIPGANSVIDVGCGTGSWLAQYAACGIKDYLGVDGFLPEESLLRIPASRTLARDLTQNLALGRRFDIAQSLEVAEHLDIAAAPTFVDTLTRHSDFVVFGAAIPGQGGTYHVNEQWHSYWTALFADRGYRLIDALRPEIWYDDAVDWWYSQNTMVFVNLANTELIASVEARVRAPAQFLDFVHPRCFRAFRDALEDQRHKYCEALEYVDHLRKQVRQLQDALEDPHHFGAIGEIENLRMQVVQFQEEGERLKLLLPKRFMRSEYLKRLEREKRSWSSVAFRHPLKVSLWMDLFRLQRRRARGLSRIAQHRRAV